MKWLQSSLSSLLRVFENGYEKAFNGGRPFNWARMMSNALKEPQSAPHVPQAKTQAIGSSRFN